MQNMLVSQGHQDAHYREGHCNSHKDSRRGILDVQSRQNQPFKRLKQAAITLTAFYSHIPKSCSGSDVKRCQNVPPKEPDSCNYQSDQGKTYDIEKRDKEGQWALVLKDIRLTSEEASCLEKECWLLDQVILFILRYLCRIEWSQ